MAAYHNVGRIEVLWTLEVFLFTLHVSENVMSWISTHLGCLPMAPIGPKLRLAGDTMMRTVQQQESSHKISVGIQLEDHEGPPSTRHADDELLVSRCSYPGQAETRSLPDRQHRGCGPP